MVKSRTPSPAELPRPALALTRDEAKAKLEKRLTLGQDLLQLPISNEVELEKARADRTKWHDFNFELLSTIFSNEKFAEEYETKSSPGAFFVSMGHTPFAEKIEDYRESVTCKINALESIVARLELILEPVGNLQSPKHERGGPSLDRLHPSIRSGCTSLYESGHYGEAVEKGFKIVRGRLRELTGYETGSDAFGRGHLYVKGANASHVDKDFQEAIKFLTMSIDNFRNEKAHTTDSGVRVSGRAYEYLVLSSLAMHHLDKAEIRKTP